MKRYLLLIICSGVLLFGDDIHKVVYDLTTSSVKKFEKNILKGVVFNKGLYEKRFEELKVSVVIHGEAYRFFVKNVDTTRFKKDMILHNEFEILKKRIRSLHENYDVEFLMCGAGMSKYHLKPKDIVAFVKIIPNSTIGLIDKQNEGYAYIPVGR